MTRRVVTGLDAQGRSCVLFDDEVRQENGVSNFIWRSRGLPADNSGSEDRAGPFAMAQIHEGGCDILMVEYPPGFRAEMHATDTLDYLIVLEGEAVIELERGEARIGPGDVLVDRGVIHAWRTDPGQGCRFICVNAPAHPVGAGRTV
jgi:quercetin dioxygenase-like cupin family protein